MWVCVRSRILWVSPTNSPVRLGVSPAAPSTLRDVFTQRFEALFPCTGALGCVVYLTPPHSSRFIYAGMWGRRQGLLAATLPALFVPQSATSLGPPAVLPPVLSAPGAHLCPSYQSG